MVFDLAGYSFDLQTLIDFFSRPAPLVSLELFVIFGWLFFAYLLLFVGLFFYADVLEGRQTSKWKWTLLAIDIPQLNVQTPMAVEQLFAHLSGALSTPDLADKFWHGFRQRWFSLEVISIEGYIQFLIRTEEKFRDLVEAAIYAQYPEAEIVEVEDYTGSVPEKFPNDTHDMWAADFVLTEGDAFPIRTYREFEHQISKDTILKDPMGAFLESFTRLGPGEQMWFQILIEPTSSAWKEKAILKIKEIIGETVTSKKRAVDVLTDTPLKLLESVGDQVFSRESSAGKKEIAGPLNKLQYLTPGQTKLVEAMEKKISKIGFNTKIRAVYVARKEVFKRERGVNLLIGSMSQFNVLNSNAFRPTSSTDFSYFFKKQKSATHKNLLMTAYKKRKLKVGAKPFVMNIEELATVWHFPMSHIKTPSVQKSAGKQIEPPAGLPVEVVPPLISEELAENKKSQRSGLA